MDPINDAAALARDGYHLPTARLRRRRVTLLMSASLGALFAWLAYRAAQDTSAVLGHDHEAALWSLLMLAASHQTLLAWLDKPYTVTEQEQARLDQIFLEVSIPVYNESREIVDRTLYALTVGTRLPQRVVLADDGSRVDYSDLREFWLARYTLLGIELVWHRQANAGKRHAQAVAFRAAGEGVMVTLDSDTALTRTALAEILKPFARPDVWSVAGVELAYNKSTNLLTRINAMRQESWQMVQCAALNRFGAIMVNRGTFAAYRAALVRETVEAYLSETFAGRPVKYSDDSLLTLYALGRGKAVQQCTAFQLSEYPDRVSHALRQWIRWMRGSTIRSIWRARYLRSFSYAWWINLVNWWQLLASSAAYLYVFVYLPLHGRFSLSAISAAVGASYLANVRTLLIARSDQDALSQLDTWLISPLSWLWSLLVLRPIRFYATLTCANNGWGTRGAVEVGKQTGQGHEAAPAFAGPGPLEPTVATVGLVLQEAPAEAFGTSVWEPPAVAATTAAFEAVPDEAPVATTAQFPAVPAAAGRARRKGRLRTRPRSRRGSTRLRTLLPAAAGLGVAAVSSVVIVAGVTSSFHDNVQNPQPVAPRAAAPQSSAATIDIPTDRHTTPPAGNGTGAQPVAQVGTLPAPSSSSPAASASATAAPSRSSAPSGSASPSASASSNSAAPSSSAASPTPTSTGSGATSAPPAGTPSSSANATPSGSPL